MAIESLRQVGQTFASPVLTFFSQQLAQFPSNHYFFLAREGYWLEQAYDTYQHARGVKTNSQYLLASRAFLFKLGLIEPKSYDISLDFSFSGSLYELMRTRFMLSDVSIRKLFDEKQQTKSIVLPHDLEKIAQLLQEKLPQLEAIIAPSMNAYRHYLSSLGFFDHKQVHLVDLGYSGSIQTLLSLLFHVDSVGHYLIASKPGQRTHNGNQLTMKGYLNEGSKLGEGYTPLDRSMLLEAVLTAPTGQFQDIRFDETGEQTYQFFFGRKVRSQHNFHTLEAMMKAALESIEQHSVLDISFEKQEVEQILTSHMKKQGMFPRSCWEVFSLDDDIAGEGTLDALDFWGLKR
ncbi:hypothetical protein [Vibrio sp. 10N]|uniref:hypothetical protein n=1 Tax=Vibrio sp. 10N TaxID=3058938 RepID=UPI0028146A08|nr:hypothetical protein VB10N_29190 [Vibrio sp. 10N]